MVHKKRYDDERNNFFIAFKLIYDILFFVKLVYAFLPYQIAHSVSSKKKKKTAHSVCERCAIQKLTDYSAKTKKKKKNNKNKN